MTKCCIEGCDRQAIAKDMCPHHYNNMKRNGSPTRVLRPSGATTEERFWRYVEKTDGCWLWTGARTHGYGNFYVPLGDGKYKQIQAHRWAYEALVGPIPDGATLDHLCHTRAITTCRDGKACPHRRCVRPDHLEPIPLAINIQRGGNGTKTHCKRGHEFTPENTYIMKNGGRSCRACMKIHQQNRKARQRQNPVI